MSNIYRTHVYVSFKFGRARDISVDIRGIDAPALGLRLTIGCDKADLSWNRRVAAVLLLGRRVAHDKRVIIRGHDPLDTCTLLSDGGGVDVEGSKVDGSDICGGGRRLWEGEMESREIFIRRRRESVGRTGGRKRTPLQISQSHDVILVM